MGRESIYISIIIEPRGDIMPQITKWGNSQGVRLEKSKLEKSGFDIEEEVTIEYQDNMIIIRKVKTMPISIYDLFQSYDKVPHKTELIDFGDPVGNEEWK